MSKLQVDHLFCLPVAIPVSIAFNLAAALSSPLLSPVVTGAALYALTRSPEQVRGPILTTLQRYLSNSTIKRSVTTLSVVFGLGLVRQVHLFLSDLALNNFRFRSEKRRYDWPNEIAVVTGAAGGIGSIMVKDLMSKGVKVMALDIAPQLPDSLLAQSVGRVAYYQCDLTDRDAVMAVAKRIQAEHGDPSILINNAGIAYTHTTLQATPAALDKIFAINTIAPYWTIQAFLPAMLRNRKGHIAVTASMASWIGSPALGPYSATKVGILAVHESLRQELRSIHNCPEILVTNAHPTFVRTPMTTSSIEWLEQMTSLIEPEEVSNGVMRNIFACRGGEVIMPGGLGMLPTYLRSMPHWMSYALLRTGEARAPEMDVSGERRMA